MVKQCLESGKIEVLNLWNNCLNIKRFNRYNKLQFDIFTKNLKKLNKIY